MILKPRYVFFILILIGLQVHADKPAVYSTSDGAIEGYDTVAYFTQGKPVKGVDQYRLEWNGALFKFSSEENLSLFKNDPEKYAPQYGGYCAYAVSEGATASTVPEAWTIVDNKLYLNFSRGVQSSWSKDIPQRISAANENWPGVLDR